MTTTIKITLLSSPDQSLLHLPSRPDASCTVIIIIAKVPPREPSAVYPLDQCRSPLPLPNRPDVCFTTITIIVKDLLLPLELPGLSLSPLLLPNRPDANFMGSLSLRGSGFVQFWITFIFLPVRFISFLFVRFSIPPLSFPLFGGLLMDNQSSERIRGCCRKQCKCCRLRGPTPLWHLLDCTRCTCRSCPRCWDCHRIRPKMYLWQIELLSSMHRIGAQLEVSVSDSSKG